MPGGVTEAVAQSEEERCELGGREGRGCTLRRKTELVDRRARPNTNVILSADLWSPD